VARDFDGCSWLSLKADSTNKLEATHDATREAQIMEVDAQSEDTSTRRREEGAQPLITLLSTCCPPRTAVDAVVLLIHVACLQEPGFSPDHGDREDASGTS
jgi:hypothetical protein